MSRIGFFTISNLAMAIVGEKKIFEKVAKALHCQQFPLLHQFSSCDGIGRAEKEERKDRRKRRGKRGEGRGGGESEEKEKEEERKLLSPLPREKLSR